MQRTNKFLFLFLSLTIISLSINAQGKIACIGNSITYGSATEDRVANSFPGQLDQLLGDEWIVKNFGVSGATMLKNGDKSYWNQEAFEDAKNFQPDIVIIKLGTNDTKPQNWKYKDEYTGDYLDMIKIFRELESKPDIWICLPVPAYEDRWGIRDSIIKNDIIPFVTKIAEDTGVKLIDLYNPLSGKPEYFPDKIHPDNNGAKIIASLIANRVRKERPFR